MELDRNGLEVLDRDACLARLASVAVARIGLSMRALPVILPVNFVIDGDEIIIRTTAGAKTESALRNAVVAFEADEYDPIAHTGWSVLVQGRSRIIDDPAEIAHLDGLWVRAWGTPLTDRWIAISMEIVTGRRIQHDELAGAPRPAPPSPGDLQIEATWEAWAAIRADYHTTSADPRTMAAESHLTWGAANPDDPSVPPVDP